MFMVQPDTNPLRGFVEFGKGDSLAMETTWRRVQLRERRAPSC
jgi:hypothetical protein